MSTAKTQVQQAALCKSLPTRQQKEVADIQLEMGRAFEVASQIERAICKTSNEGIEEFITRVLAELFKCPVDTRLRISRVRDFSYIGDIIVPKLASDRFASGSEVSLLIQTTSQEEARCAIQLFEKYSLNPQCPKIPSSGLVRFEPWDENTMEPNALCGLICSLLQSLWTISNKAEIECFFDHQDTHTDRRLASSDEFRDDIIMVSSSEPKSASLMLKHDGIVLGIQKPRAGKFRFIFQISNLNAESKSQIRAFFTAAGCEPDPEFGDEGWVGENNTDLAMSFIVKVLTTCGVGLDSMVAHFHLRQRFW